MQPNNKIRPFSTNTDNKYSDSDVGTLPVIGTGAVEGGIANSKLYNSLSANTSLVACALADLIASQNQSITFGQETPIDTWLQAVKDTFATTLVVNSIINGTTTVGNATNVETNINGKPISSIFESDGTTVKNATNAIKKADGTFAGLRLDENNVLKVGDEIISRKKLLWSGNSSSVDLSAYDLQANDIIEFVMNGKYYKFVWNGAYTTLSYSEAYSTSVSSPVERASITIRNISVTLNTNNNKLVISVGTPVDVSYYSDGLSVGSAVKLNNINDGNNLTITKIYKIIE